MRANSKRIQFTGTEGVNILERYLIYTSVIILFVIKKFR